MDGESNQLNDLSRRVSAAAAEAKAPPAPGESKPLVFTSDLLGEDGWSLLWKVVRAVREHDAKTFVRFSELTLALRIVAELEADGSLDLGGLVAGLAAEAEEFGPRVISTPLSNVLMNNSAVRLTDDAVLVRGYLDKNADDTDEDVLADLSLPEWLGARMSRPLRFVDLSERFDTRRTATLLTIEHGVPPLALARARARAQYAIAMWTVLSPPEGRKVLPDLGVWVPQPTMHVPQRHRALNDPEDPHVGLPEEGGGFNEYGMFQLPEEEDLRLPFEAMARLERRGAQAVLSASLLLMAAGRASRLQPSERVRALMSAIESLGETSSGKKARKRFLRLARHHGTDTAAEARGWTPARVEVAIDRMRKARNIATHGSDAVLLDLGYPADAVRKMMYETALGTELAAGSIQSDLPILVHVVGRTIDMTVRELASDGWSDKAYMSYFNTK